MSWPMVALGELCEMSSGGTPLRSESRYYEGGSIPWVKIGDIENADEGVINRTEEFITEEGLAAINDRSFAKGTVLFAMYGSVGKVAVAGMPLATNQAILGIRPDQSKLSTDYLVHWLRSRQHEWEHQARGVALKNLSAGIVKQQMIPLPPLPEQRRIAAILDKAQALVANDKRTLVVYDQLAKSLFLEMFGDPVRNERGWEVVKLVNACIQITDGTHFSPPMVEVGYPYVTAKHIKEYGLDFASAPTYVDQEHHDEIYRRCKPELGDVLYIKDGATTGIAAVNTMAEPFSLLSSVALFKPNKELLTGTYLCHWLNHEGVRDRLIRTHMAGAAIKRFTLQKINQFEIPLPPLEQQHAYEGTIRQLFTQRAQAKASLHRSEALFGSLLQGAFAGGLGG